MSGDPCYYDPMEKTLQTKIFTAVLTAVTVGTPAAMAVAVHANPGIAAVSSHTPGTHYYAGQHIPGTHYYAAGSIHATPASFYHG